MLIPADVIKATEQRYAHRTSERSEKQKHLNNRDYLAADSPDVVSKWLRRRGLDGATTTAKSDPASETLVAREQSLGLERTLGINDLVGVAFLERGCRSTKTVARISVVDHMQRLRGYGTGFLVSPRLLLTNYHVFGIADDSRFSSVEFDFDIRGDGSLAVPTLFRFRPDEFFFSDKALDFALVAIESENPSGKSSSSFGWNPLIAEEGKVIVGQYVNIIQHPNGERKQIVLRDSQIVDRLENFLHYRADTNPGSSGSPVFNDLWEVVALHHSGVPNRDPQTGQILALDGRTWQPEMGDHQISWKANEGVRISRILAQLQNQPMSPSQRRLLDQVTSQPPFTASNGSNEINAKSPALPSVLPAGPKLSPDGTVTWTLPISISVNLGASGLPFQNPQQPRAQVADTSAPRTPIDANPPGRQTPAETAVLEAARETFRQYPGVVNVRLGWRFANGWITNERAIVVSVREKRSTVELAKSKQTPLPETFQGMPVDVTFASLEELLRMHGNGKGAELFEAATVVNTAEITYRPPQGAKLEQLTDQMRVLAHASPDAGWPTLQSFLKATTSTLTIGMYDFGATHIRDAIRSAGTAPGFRQLTLSIQKGESLGGGTKANDLTDAEIVESLQLALRDKFRCAWVTTGMRNGWIATSYHIKVAVRDRNAFWLSSGNWQSSNQPDHDPRADNPPQSKWLRNYNREWHAIVEHKGLAETFENFLEHYFENNPRQPNFDELGLPHLLIPQDAFTAWERAAGWQPTYKQPFNEKRSFTV